jgi:hypothetical protein
MESFNCPITYEQMSDPVIAMDGHSYERSALERWFDESARSGRNIDIGVISPMTGEPMGLMLIPNYALKKAINEYNSRTTTRTQISPSISAREGYSGPRSDDNLILSAFDKYLNSQINNFNMNNMNNFNTDEKFKKINNIRNCLIIIEKMKYMDVSM